MSSVASPFGLKPAQPPSGVIRQAQGTIESGFGTNIFQYSPVGLDADGFIVPKAPSISATIGRILGAFMGVEFTRPDGRRAVANNWVASEVATEIVCYYTYDPWIIYEMQANGSVVQAMIGDTFQYAALAGNAITGLSSIALTTATTSAPATDPLRIVGVNPGSDNVIGDDFTIVQVQINKHQFNQSSLLNPVDT